MKKILEKYNILSQALPYIEEFKGKVFIIKYGGSILKSESIHKTVLEDIVRLSGAGMRIVLVHGAGPHINEELKKKGIKSHFHRGLRVTDKKTLSVVHKELSRLNAHLVKRLDYLGAVAVGIRGEDNVIAAFKKQANVSLGFVGSVESVNTQKVKKALEENKVVVLSPMGKDSEGQLYNINADESASAIATALKAEKLIFLTNVKGVMLQVDNHESLLSTVKTKQVPGLIRDRVIQSGMIPKVMACVDSLEMGIHKGHIIDAGIKHALLLEVFTDEGIGTQIIN